MMIRFIKGVSFVLILASICGICCGQESSLAIQRSENDSGDGVTGGGAGDGMIGWEFIVEKPCQATALGFLYVKLNASQVGLWDEKKNLVASVDFKRSSKGKQQIDGFKFVDIEPVELSQGKTYVIGALYQNRGRVESYSPSCFYSSGAIRWLATRHSRTEGGLVFPSKSFDGQIDLGPNLILKDKPSARMHYSKQDMAPQHPHQKGVRHKFDFQWIVIPEKKDKSHLREHVTLISVFGTKDGTVREICLDGMPVGGKLSTSLARTLPKLVDSRVDVNGIKPKLRVAKLSWLDSAEVAKMVNEAMGRENNAAETKKLEFSERFLNARSVEQVDPETRFVVHGNLAQDTWTGLFWQLDGTAIQKVNFYKAAEVAGTVQIAELAQWRVPTSEELTTIFPAVQEPFVNSGYKPDLAGSVSYWTSEVVGKNYANLYQWYGDGGPNGCYADKNFGRVRLVHDSIGILGRN